MKKTLYLGTDPSYFFLEGHIIHYPIIKIIPRTLADPELKASFDDLQEYTHIIFTSKNAVKVFFDIARSIYKDLSFLQERSIFAIGKVTCDALKKEGFVPVVVSSDETQEGMIKELELEDLEEAYVFFPRSSLSRPVLLDYLYKNGIRHQACNLYDTVAHLPGPPPNLKQIDEIVFTSPSTVEAFYSLFGFIPTDKSLKVIGPITEEALLQRLK